MSQNISLGCSCSGKTLIYNLTANPYLEVEAEFLNASNDVVSTVSASSVEAVRADLIFNPTSNINCGDIIHGNSAINSDEEEITVEVPEGMNVDVTLYDMDGLKITSVTGGGGNVPKSRIRVKKRTL